MRKETMTALNRLIRQMMGKPMTKKQLKLRDELREKVRTKEITVVEAHKIWERNQ